MLLLKNKDYTHALPYFIKTYRIFDKINSPNIQVIVEYLNQIHDYIGEAAFDVIVSDLENHDGTV